MRVLWGSGRTKRVNSKNGKHGKKETVKSNKAFFAFPFETASKYRFNLASTTDVKSAKQYFLTSMDSLECPQNESEWKSLVSILSEISRDILVAQFEFACGK